MERSHYTTLGSVLTAVLFAGAVLLSGCTDTLTGVAPENDQNITIQQRAQHNQVSNGEGGGTTEPDAGHNTSDED